LGKSFKSRREPVIAEKLLGSRKKRHLIIRRGGKTRENSFSFVCFGFGERSLGGGDNLGAVEDGKERGFEAKEKEGSRSYLQQKRRNREIRRERIIGKRGRGMKMRLFRQ